MIIIDSLNGKTVAPMVTFGVDADPRKNFTFGARKAGLLLVALETHGMDAVISMLRVVAGVVETPSVATQPVLAERPDTATVMTPIVPPVKAIPPVKTPKAKSVPIDDSAERAILLGQIMASGVKWRFVAKNWKTSILRDKVAALPPVAIAPSVPTLPVSASPTSKADTPTIEHTDTIDGKTYVLFSTGQTKLAYLVNGQTRYRKTDKVISKAPLISVPAPTPVPVPVPQTAKTATIPYAVDMAKGQHGTYVIMSDDTIRRIG